MGYLWAAMLIHSTTLYSKGYQVRLITIFLKVWNHKKTTATKYANHSGDSFSKTPRGAKTFWSLIHVYGIAWKPEFRLEFGLELTWLARSCLSNYYLLLTYSYSATTWTGPLQTKLANRSINWEQRTAPFLVNRPVKPKNGNNGLTTKIWNSTKLPRVADVSETLSVFDWFVSILFFKTFFDFSTFQTVSVNYKILTIFSTMTFAHCIQLKLNWVGGIYDIPTAMKACFRPSPRWNEPTVDRKWRKK